MDIIFIIAVEGGRVTLMASGLERVKRMFLLTQIGQQAKNMIKIKTMVMDMKTFIKHKLSSINSTAHPGHLS